MPPSRAPAGCPWERGLTTPDPGEASVKAAMMAAARCSSLPADHTKVGNDSPARFESLADLDLLVNAGLDDGAAAAIGLAGPASWRPSGDQ